MPRAPIGRLIPSTDSGSSEGFVSLHGCEDRCACVQGRARTLSIPARVILIPGRYSGAKSTNEKVSRQPRATYAIQCRPWTAYPPHFAAWDPCPFLSTRSSRCSLDAKGRAVGGAKRLGAGEGIPLPSRGAPAARGTNGRSAEVDRIALGAEDVACRGCLY